MIYDLHISVLLFLYLIIIAIIISIYFLKHSQKKKILFWKCLFVLYLLIIIKVTVFPLTFKRFPWMDNISYITIQWKPFHSIVAFIKQKNYIQIVGNIFLLMPLPLILQGIAEKNFSKSKCFFCICSASLSIEIFQMGINYITHIKNHVVDIDDIILNVTGGLLLIIFLKPINYLTNIIASLATGDTIKKSS